MSSYNFVSRDKIPLGTLGDVSLLEDGDFIYNETLEEKSRQLCCSITNSGYSCDNKGKYSTIIYIKHGITYAEIECYFCKTHLKQIQKYTYLFKKYLETGLHIQISYDRIELLNPAICKTYYRLHYLLRIQHMNILNPSDIEVLGLTKKIKPSKKTNKNIIKVEKKIKRKRVRIKVIN